MRSSRRLYSLRLSWLVWACLAFTAWTQSAYSTLRVTPLFMDLTSTGPGIQGEFRIGNDRDTPTAIEVTVTRQESALDSSGPGTSATEDFAVFPAQALIEPGQTQIFRIKYVGEADLPQTTRYAMSFHELPLRFDQSNPTAAISLLLDLRVGIFVSHPSATEELEIESVKKSDGKLQFTVANAGARYAALADYWLSVLDGKTKLGSLPGDVLLDQNRSSVVPPFGSTTFVLSLPPGMEKAQSIAIRDVRED